MTSVEPRGGGEDVEQASRTTVDEPVASLNAAAALQTDNANTASSQPSQAFHNGGDQSSAESLQQNQAAIESAPSSSIVNMVNAAPSPVTTPGGTALTAAHPPAATKKFNSLSVTKQFLQKASPTLSNATTASAATSPAMAKQGSGGAASLAPTSSSRLSTMMPASRLSTAKLANTSKPTSQGWAQVAPPPSSTHSPFAASAATSSQSKNDSSADPIPAAAVVSNAAANMPSPAIIKPAITSNAASASPKLVAALTRSTSPHIKAGETSKGSPGLRNAALSGVGRSASPSITAGSGATHGSMTSARAPWATMTKNGTSSERMPRSLGRPSEFPTAAEAAQAKLEAEKRERVAAAEAAAKAENALQNLEKFRGTTLGEGHHWDEMDDDDLEEVMDFGGGAQDTASGKAVTKEERFRDVGHDRSWPQHEQRAANGDAGRSLFNARAKAETVAVRSGEGISLEAPALSSDSYAGTGYHHSRERRAFPRDDSHSGSGAPSRHYDQSHAHQSAPHQHHHQPAQQGSAASTVPVRAWGPLAQRQASLNPDAPKSTTVAASAPNPSLKPAAEERKPVQTSAPTSKPSSTGPTQRKQADPAPVTKTTAPLTKASPPKASVPAPRPPASNGRALPPHLAAAARQTEPQSNDGGSASTGLGAQRHERSDWETARPKRLEEEEQAAKSDIGAPGEEVIVARPYGKLVASGKQQQQQSRNVEPRPQRRGGEKDQRTEIPASVTAPMSVSNNSEPQEQREEMLSAAERARKRRQVEEEERQKERERALAKAAAIEAKMRQEEERKRSEEQSRQEAKVRAEEAAKRKELEKAQQANASKAKESSKMPALNVASLPAPPSVLSPSDEATSWRRSTNVNVHSITQSAAPTRGPLQGQDPGSTKILLRRPSSSTTDKDATQAKGAVASTQEAVQSQTKLAKNAPREAKKRESRITDANGKSDAIVDAPLLKSSRVEIIAPTDEGAREHMQQLRQREREARSAKSRNNVANAPLPLVGVLKPATQSAAPRPNVVPSKPEPETTRSEVPFDPAPVWNRFNVRLGVRGKPRRGQYNRNMKELRAQTARISIAERTLAAVSILSWDPPIQDLSTRTLSRDDQFFPKKYLRGVVIKNVVLPSRSVQQLAKERQDARKHAEAAAQLRRQQQPQSMQPFTNSQLEVQTLTEPSLTATQPNALRASTAHPSVRVPGGKGAADVRQRNHQSNSRLGGLSGQSATSSVPVELAKRYKDDDELKSTSIAMEEAKRSASTGMQASRSASSTWGENSLTFAGLNPSPEGAAAETERNRIKDVWSIPSDASATQQKPAQNSLKGIADDFPSTMSLMTALDGVHSDDNRAGNVAPGAAYQDASTSTADTMPVVPHAASSAPNSRVYSPLASNEHNGSGGHLSSVMTASSSPVANSNALVGGMEKERMHHQGNGARLSSQSPSSSTIRGATNDGMTRPLQQSFTLPSSQQTSGHQQFVQQERGGARAAFGPYAYPSTFSGFDQSLAAHSSIPSTQQYQSAYGGSMGGNFASNYSAPSHQQQARFGGGGGGGGGGSMGNYHRYRGASGNNSGAFMASGLHGNGFDNFAGTNGGAVSTNINGAFGTLMSSDRNGFGVGPSAMDVNTLGSPGLSTAGWPLDTQASMNAAYGTPPSSYYAAQPSAYGTFDNSVPQHQQQIYSRPAYHTRVPSSGYRGYGSGSGGGGGGGGGNAYHHQQQHGRRTNRSSGSYAAGFAGSMSSGEGYPSQQQHQYAQQQQQQHGGSGNGGSSSMMHATAKPFHTGKVDSQGGGGGGDDDRSSGVEHERQNVQGHPHSATDAVMSGADGHLSSTSPYATTYNSALW